MIEDESAHLNAFVTLLGMLYPMRYDTASVVFTYVQRAHPLLPFHSFFFHRYNAGI